MSEELTPVNSRERERGREILLNRSYNNNVTFNLDRIKKNNTRLLFVLRYAGDVFFPQLRPYDTVNRKFGIFWYTIKQYLGYDRCLRKFSDRASRRDFRIWFAATQPARLAGRPTRRDRARSASGPRHPNHRDAAAAVAAALFSSVVSHTSLSLSRSRREHDGIDGRACAEQIAPGYARARRSANNCTHLFILIIGD